MPTLPSELAYKYNVLMLEGMVWSIVSIRALIPLRHSLHYYLDTWLGAGFTRRTERIDPTFTWVSMEGSFN